MRRLIVSLIFIFCTTAAASASAAEPPASFGMQLVRLINDYRAAQGLPPLVLTDKLVELANEHSQAMAIQEGLSHDGFQSRFRRAGSNYCVENLAWNHPTAEAVLDDWRLSPSHHVNLLDPKVLRVGIGRSVGYVTYFACR